MQSQQQEEIMTQTQTMPSDFEVPTTPSNGEYDDVMQSSGNDQDEATQTMALHDDQDDNEGDDDDEADDDDEQAVSLRIPAFPVQRQQQLLPRNVVAMKKMKISLRINMW